MANMNPPKAFRDRQGKGRAKGVPNKVTRTMKQMLAEAANELNLDRKTSLVALAKSKGGLAAFWSIAQRGLIPSEISGSLEIKLPAIVELPPKKKRE